MGKQLVIPDVAEATLRQLERLAAERGTSIEAEAREVLERSVGEAADRLALSRALRRQFADRAFPDATELIREDRDR
jgi:plasmid stability protein